MDLFTPNDSTPKGPRIEFIEITNLGPVESAKLDYSQGPIIVATGGNGSGKSTAGKLFDAIRGKLKTSLLQDGKESGGYRVQFTRPNGQILNLTCTLKRQEVDGLGKQVIETLSFTDEIERPVTKADASALIKEMVGSGNSFDLNTFLSSQPAERKRMLSKIVNLDLDEIERQIEAAEGQKTILFRAKEDAEARFEPVRGYSRIDAKREPLKMDALLAELNEINKFNSELGQKQHQAEAHKREAARLNQENEAKRGRIETLRAEIAKLEGEISRNTDGAIEQSQAATADFHWLDENPAKSTEETERKLKEIETENEKIRTAKEAERLENASFEAERAHLEQVEVISNLRIERLNAIKAQPLPVEGLTFDPHFDPKKKEVGLLFNGHPLETASTGQQAIIALQLSEFCSDGSLKWLHFDAHSLDPVNRQRVIEWLKTKGYQALIERPASTLAEMGLHFTVE